MFNFRSYCAWSCQVILTPAVDTPTVGEQMGTFPTWLILTGVFLVIELGKLLLSTLITQLPPPPSDTQ